ncbi:TauD/TfdA family dioxygenase [Nocardia puris]|uniref:TfdA family taurine catabolism dioxygenase TauD n=1 Tax=Nocardia puris TaxID=208602 RepID=A0A366DSE8_9NOCA|nr:TauD/TfdA family dioxygenase [Nocardia puris]MBF6210685.1 TauD/TfdA family dioxygenase [Nocardia puris]MBF6364292.1 TauD/TfdA family dioxygenase [Nocardia puris]MBF6459221.1 TauD/TfdA family dioxygenase [Nocardia puris]RBO92825.1 TfdA family taurine catabolism dioxygenase TauD [Nocardia puris]
MKSVLSERKTFHPHDIERRELSAATAAAVRRIAGEICATLPDGPRAAVARTLTDPALLTLIEEGTADLPEEVRHAMRAPGDAGACVVRRIPVTDDEFGPTPPSWREAARWSADTRRGNSFQLDVVLLLLARAAGEPFGWHGQQDGRLVNNILPTPGHEDEQSGASSKTLLCPHTEDAFHPARANLLMLGCLRNPDRVGTTVSSVRRAELTDDERALLSTPTLPILPDVSYGTGHEKYTPPPLPTMWDAAETSGGASAPTLRYDPAYTPLDDADPEFRRAYTRLTAELERVCVTAALAPGELLLVDNDVAVHGRVPFTARYDGTDRWLKRVNIRLPERPRRPAEADENGYGQRIVAPFRNGNGRAETERETTTHDRGTVEHS